MRLFQECLPIQGSLVQQVLDAINPTYLSHLHNRITGQVLSEIHALVIYLFLTYRKDTAQSLRKDHDDTAAMEYSLTNLIYVILTT